jgi:hypothetical protein
MKQNNVLPQIELHKPTQGNINGGDSGYRFQHLSHYRAF